MNIVVVGAGFMGANHARIINNNPNARVACVVDTNHARAKELAEGYQVPWQTALDGVTADAAIIATPTFEHHTHAVQALNMGMHVLVEKPIASSAIHARDMINTAKRMELVLQVGHVERYNPAFLQLQTMLSKVPLAAAFQRYSPHPQRITDGVAHDMLIHDADLALTLFGARVDDVVARSVIGNSGVDEIVAAAVTFASGAVASFTANRLAQNKVRQIDVTMPDYHVTVDLLRQTIAKQSWAAPGLSSGSQPAFQQSATVEIPYRSVAGEPLQLQLDAFIAACRGTKPVPVTGEHGMNALKLCDWIRHATRI